MFQYITQNFASRYVTYRITGIPETAQTTTYADAV